MEICCFSFGREAAWRLVWADEFERDGLPDSLRWAYEEGPLCNEEPQYYTVGHLENARVDGGT